MRKKNEIELRNSRLGTIIRGYGSTSTSRKGLSAFSFDLFDFLAPSERYRSGLSKNLSWGDYIGKAMLVSFVVALMSGCALLAGFQPVSEAAYSSIEYIQYKMWMGWLFRGMHHYSSAILVILAVIRMFRILVRRAYRGRGHLTWVMGLVFLVLVICIGLSGYILNFASHPLNGFPEELMRFSISGTYLLHIGLAMVSVLLALFGTYVSRKISLRDFHTDKKIPGSILWGIPGLLFLLALVFPPLIGSGTEQIALSATPVRSFSFSLNFLYFLYTEIGFAIVVTIFLLLVIVPELDKYKKRGAHPIISGFAVALMLTMVLLVYGMGHSPFNMWIFYLISAFVWVIAGVVGFRVEWARKQTEKRKILRGETR